LWQILDRYYDDFEKSYPEKFEKKYGFFRPVGCVNAHTGAY